MQVRRFKTRSSRVVHKNPWFTVRHDTVTHPDGRKGNYFVVDRPDMVSIAAVNKKKEICLITLHRYPTDTVSIEVPAGGTEGQRPLIAAKRELAEETGYVASRWKKIGQQQTLNGLVTDWNHIYLATGLRMTKQHAQEEEGISNVQMVPLRKAVRLIRKGTLQDTHSVAAIMTAALELGILT